MIINIDDKQIEKFQSIKVYYYKTYINKKEEKDKKSI